MNNGWIPLRRGLLDHIISGNLNASETATFAVLLMNAHAATGSGFINSAVLIGTFFPEMSKDTAQRTLASLEDKGFIWRFNPTRSKRAYPYWVNKFECTKGPNRLRLTDLSQVFESNDIKDIKYVKRATEMSAEVPTEMSAEMSAEMSDSYDKDTNKDTDIDKTTKASSSLKRFPEASRGSNRVKQDAEASSGSDVVKQVPEAVGSSSLKRLPEAMPEAFSKTVQIRWQSGEDCGWFSGDRRLDYTEVNAAIGPLGLRWERNEIFDGDVMLPWEEAKDKIEGITR